MNTSRNNLSTSLITLLVVLASGAVSAQEPVAVVQQETKRFSLKYIDVPVALNVNTDPILPPPTAPLDAENDPEFARRLETIQQYNSAVEQTELSGGAWDSGLVEELTSLGQLHQLQGYHPEAIAAFDRAIHINRISSGLHTLEQIPAVEQLIESYLAIGDWEQADLYNNYLFYIQKKAFGITDPRIIPVLDRLGRWNIQAFNLNYGPSLGLRLISAQILFNAAARMVDIHFGKDDERFVAFQRSIAISAYLVSRSPHLMADLDRPEYRTTETMLRQQLNERAPLRPRGFRAGEEALLEIVQYYTGQDDNVYELAEALTDLADWNLIFDRRNAANQKYHEAWEVLQGSEGAAEAIQRLFGQVVPVPTYRGNSDALMANSALRLESEPLAYDFADVSFDVTENGSVRRIRMLSEETKLNSNLLARLRRQVRLTFFRPLIVDGEPVRSNDNQFRYRYWY